MEETVLMPHAIEQQEMVYQDRNQQIFRVLARFHGFTKEYLVSDHGPRAGIVAVRAGEVLLVRQYRLVINGLSYEIPGGKLNETETPLAAATRECLEETGVRCLNLKPLLGYHPGLDICRNYTSLFYTEDVEECTHDSGQRIWVPLSQCVDMVFSQQVVDSFSIIALLAYRTQMERWACQP